MSRDWIENYNFIPTEAFGVDREDDDTSGSYTDSVNYHYVPFGCSWTLLGVGQHFVTMDYI